MASPKTTIGWTDDTGTRRLVPPNNASLPEAFNRNVLEFIRRHWTSQLRFEDCYSDYYENGAIRIVSR
jgi:hypothetical protein